MEKKERIVGLTPRVLFLGVVFVVLLNVVVVFGHYDSPLYNYNHWGFSWTHSENPFIIQYSYMFLVSLIVSVLSIKLKFTPQEITCLMMMMLIAGIFVVWEWNTTLESFVAGVCQQMYQQGPESPVTADILKYMSPLLGPKVYSAYEGLSVVGAPIPAEWIGPIAFIILWMYSYTLFGFFLGALAKRLYVDTEALPFPYGAVDYVLINATTHESATSKIPRIFKMKWLWIGLLIEFLETGTLSIRNALEAPYGAQALIPLGPGASMFDVDLTPLGIIPYVPMVFSTRTIFIASFLIMPLNTILSFIVAAFIAYYLMGPIAYAMGGLPEPKYGGGFKLWRHNSPAQSGHLWFGIPCFFMAIQLGAILAIILWPLWRGRRVVAQLIKGIWSKEARDPRDPLPIPIIWAGALIFGAIWFAGFLLIGIPVLEAIILWAWLMIYLVGYARSRAESGMMSDHPSGGDWWNSWNFGRAILHAVQGTTGTFGMNAETFNLYYALNIYTWPCGQNQFPMACTLEAFSVGEATKTRPRDILISTLIPIIIMVPLTILLSTWIFYQFSPTENPVFTVKGDGAGPARSEMYNPTPWGYPDTLNSPEWIGTLSTVIGSFILFMIINYLRGLYPALFFQPIGAVMAFALNSPFFFLPAIIAYILKSVVIKVYGTEKYEEVLLPLASGIIIGCGVGVAMGELIIMMRTFQLFGLPPIVT